MPASCRSVFKLGAVNWRVMHSRADVIGDWLLGGIGAFNANEAVLLFCFGKPCIVSSGTPFALSEAQRNDALKREYAAQILCTTKLRSDGGP